MWTSNGCISDPIGIDTMLKYDCMVERQYLSQNSPNWLMVRVLLVSIQCKVLTLQLGLEDSISGSASSSDESGSDDSDAVVTLMNKTKLAARSPSPTSEQRSAPQTAITWFHSPPSTQLGVYKALFPKDLDSKHYLDELKAMQTGGGEEGRKWALFMVAGGHFAGAVVRVSKPEDDEDNEDEIPGKKKKPKRPKPDVEVLLHKTFHRYTSPYTSISI